MNIEDKLQRGVRSLCFIVAFAIIAVSFYFLDSTFIRTDEAWYAALLRDRPDQAVLTQFYFLYGSFFEGDIYAYRVAHFISNIISLVIFSVGLCAFLHRTNRFSILTVGSVFAFLLCFTYCVSACMLPNYINMNASSVNCALGFFLLGYTRSSRCCYLLSGAFFAPLMMIMVTNMGLYALSLLVLFVISRKVTYVLYSLAGALLFFMAYFFFMQDFGMYVENFKELFLATHQRGSSDYGMLFLLKWLALSLFYIAQFNIIGGLIIYLAYRWIRNTDNSLIRFGLWSMYIAVITAVFLCAMRSEIAMLAPFATKILKLQSYGFTPFGMLCAIVGFAYILVFLESNLSRKDKVVWSVLFFVPLLLSFGTNMPYATRAPVYMYFGAPILYFLIYIIRTKESIFIAFGGLMLAIAFFFSSPVRPNWFGQRHADQTTLMPDQRIFVHEKEASVFREVDRYLNAQDHVLVHYTWASAFSSGAKIVDYNFRLIPSSAVRILNEQYPDLERLTFITFVHERSSLEDLLAEFGDSRRVHLLREQIIGDVVLFHLSMEPLASR